MVVVVGLGYMHLVFPDANNRGAKLFRLLKLLRLVRMKRILDRWEEELYSVGAVKLAKLVALISVSAHWLCCGWFFVGYPLPDEELQGWVYRSYGENYDEVKRTTLYLDSAFWALMAVIMVCGHALHCMEARISSNTSVCTGWHRRQIWSQVPDSVY